MQTNNSAFLKITPTNKTKKNRGRYSPTATFLAIQPENQYYQEMREEKKREEKLAIQKRKDKYDSLETFKQTINALTPEEQLIIRDHLDTLHKKNDEIAEIKENLQKMEETSSESITTPALKRTKSVLKNMNDIDDETDPDPMGTWRDSTSKGGRRRKTKNKKSRRKRKRKTKRNKK